MRKRLLDFRKYFGKTVIMMILLSCAASPFLTGIGTASEKKMKAGMVDPETGTVKVTVQVRDKSGQLKPGMFARVNIIHDLRTNVILAPKNSIISEDRNSKVFVVQDSLALQKFIELGYMNSSHVQVISGLQSGDLVVTTGKASLKDSTRVDPMPISNNEDL